MHKVQIQVIHAQILQRLIQSRLHILGGVPRVPELAGDEDVGSRDATGLDAGAHLGLVAVDGRAVEVSVAASQGLFGGSLDFLGAACQVPKPTAGILAPVLSVKCVSRGIV